jgi:hypothetical protein
MPKAISVANQAMIAATDNSAVPPSWNRSDYLKAKRMYLVEGKSPKEIGNAIGCPRQKVSSIAHTRGWSALRKQAWQEMEEASDPAALAQAVQADLDDFHRSVSAQSEELTEKAFKMGRAAETPFDLNQAAGAATKLVQLNRLVHGLDKQDANGNTSVNVNFFVAKPLNLPDPKQAEPIEMEIVEPDEMTVEFG